MNQQTTVDLADLMVIKDNGDVRQYARLTTTVQQQKVRQSVKVTEKRPMRFVRFSREEDAVIIRAYAINATKTGKISRSAMARLSRKLKRDKVSISYRHRALTGNN